MDKYMLAYYGGEQPTSKEEGATHIAKWQEWVRSLGDAVVNPGTPLPQSKLVTLDGVSDDTSSDAMKGFAVVKAESMESALEIAKRDPFLQMKGTIRVSKMMEMPS